MKSAVADILLSVMWILQYCIRILAIFVAVYGRPQSYYGDNAALKTQVSLRSSNLNQNEALTGTLIN
jgi:hypothetical protein